MGTLHKYILQNNIRKNKNKPLFCMIQKSYKFDRFFNLGKKGKYKKARSSPELSPPSSKYSQHESLGMEMS